MPQLMTCYGGFTTYLLIYTSPYLPSTLFSSSFWIPSSSSPSEHTFPVYKPSPLETFKLALHTHIWKQTTFKIPAHSPQLLSLSVSSSLHRKNHLLPTISSSPGSNCTRCNQLLAPHCWPVPLLQAFTMGPLNHGPLPDAPATKHNSPNSPCVLTCPRFLPQPQQYPLHLLLCAFSLIKCKLFESCLIYHCVASTQHIVGGTQYIGTQYISK